MEILQQGASPLLSDVHLVLQILTETQQDEVIRMSPALDPPPPSSLPSYPSVVGAQLHLSHSPLVAVSPLHLPGQVLNLRLQLGLLILKLEGGDEKQTERERERERGDQERERERERRRRRPRERRQREETERREGTERGKR